MDVLGANIRVTVRLTVMFCLGVVCEPLRVTPPVWRCNRRNPRAMVGRFGVVRPTDPLCLSGAEGFWWWCLKCRARSGEQVCCRRVCVHDPVVPHPFWCRCKGGCRRPSKVPQRPLAGDRCGSGRVFKDQAARPTEPRAVAFCDDIDHIHRPNDRPTWELRRVRDAHAILIHPPNGPIILRLAHAGCSVNGNPPEVHFPCTDRPFGPVLNHLSTKDDRPGPRLAHGQGKVWQSIGHGPDDVAASALVNASERVTSCGAV